MDITKLLKEQETWLKRTQEALEKGLGQKDVELSNEFKQQRLEELKARIERLTNEKEATAKRYDAAIEAEKAEMVRLERSPTKPAEPDRPQPTGPGRTTPATPVVADPSRRSIGIQTTTQPRTAAKTVKPSAPKTAAAKKRPAAKKPGKSSKG